MSPKLVTGTVLALLLSAATGCAAPAREPASPSQAMRASEASPGAPAPASAPIAGAGAPAAPPPAPPAPSAAPGGAKAKQAAKAPSIIFRGDMRMATDEESVSKTIDRIIDIAEGAGGHVASRKDATVEIKVPSSQFRETMKAIDGLGGVISQSISADDVSEEMHDLDVRLTNLRATRARLQELMTKAGAIPDVLTVERELERVAAEIDKIEGRLEYLKSHAAMSVIDVHITPKPKPAAPVVAIAPPPPPSHPRLLELPIPWVGNVGIDPLLSLKK